MSTRTVADLRAELARREVKVYRLAVLVDVHPTRLGAMLHERIAMPAHVFARCWAVLEGDPVQSVVLMESAPAPPRLPTGWTTLTS